MRSTSKSVTVSHSIYLVTLSIRKRARCGLTRKPKSAYLSGTIIQRQIFKSVYPSTLITRRNLSISFRSCYIERTNRAQVVRFLTILKQYTNRQIRHTEFLVTKKSARFQRDLLKHTSKQGYRIRKLLRVAKTLADLVRQQIFYV